MPINITHDGVLDIATGKSRHETKWKNKGWTWTALLEKLSKTQYTHESYVEYSKSTPARQAEIKDVGGFVGGYLANGRRGKGAVNHRQTVTLDVDFGPADLWDDFTLLYGCAAAVYSTHKHSPDKPRLRFVIPLDRPVACDEYTAIARRIAGVIGIEYFDITTYQPERLMYWPSTSKDGVYVFEYQDGPWLCADEVLATYRNWKDSSEWPASERESDAVHRDIKKQGDPLEKHGAVGAFCRTFNIHDAIATYLPDVYTPCDIDGRYTYAEGTTSGGLVTYEDKYAYSHHGTDPVSMKLCNAFDLVRIHLYGLRDEGTGKSTPVHKTPSHLAMEQLACKDARVRTLIVSERIQAASDDFADLEDVDDELADISDTEVSPEEEDDTNDEWQGKLDCDKKGNILSTVDNAVLIMENAPELKGRFAFDEFSHRPALLRNLPWRKVTKSTRYITDMDEDVLYHHLEKRYGMNTTKLDKVLNVVYNRHKFHPVKDYLNGLTWDKTNRVDTILIDYLGAEDTAYVRAVTRKMLVAAVARIFEPGIKFDNVLTLTGEEGILKSTLFKKLGRDWFSDNFSFAMVADSKKSVEQLLGRWIIEIPEMSGFKKADRNEGKAFLSRQVDDCRLSYDKNKTERPRQNIFVSTTNVHEMLHENDGNRRIWPVATMVTKPTRSITNDLSPAEIDLIWSEAVALYRKGEKVYLSPDMEKVARAIQKSHTEEHPWTGIVRKYLETALPENWGTMSHYERMAFLHGGDELAPGGTVKRDKVCIPELWCEALGRPEKDMTIYNTKDLHAIMRNIVGWVDAGERLRFGKYGQQRRAYVLADAAARNSAILIKEIHKN